MVNLAVDTEHPVIIPCGANKLEGILHVPKDAHGIVLFAHGSGSSRFSIRNQFVARSLNAVKLATLLFDLLTPEEEKEDVQTLQYRFDLDFLTSRLITATDWMVEQPIAHGLPIGYFGASTGGGAALMAAAEKPNIVKAVVSRGGRPDLAWNALQQVKAPTLLIVGGNDTSVIEMNERVLPQLQTIKRLEIIPGASHLFEEPGTLQEVAQLAQGWFSEYLI
jgi:pimeloyl-ACP methyl ester carboxylesterase